MCDDFIESGFNFDFSSSLKSYKGEKICEKTYPLVDFVVETEDNFLLIDRLFQSIHNFHCSTNPQ